MGGWGQSWVRNINDMPVVIFFACLDLDPKSSFPDGHDLIGKGEAG